MKGFTTMTINNQNPFVQGQGQGFFGQPQNSFGQGQNPYGHGPWTNAF